MTHESVLSQNARATSPLAAVRQPLVFYVLTAVSVAALLFGLYANRRSTDRFASAVAEDQVWAESVQRVRSLRDRAGDVNAPGNDIFASRNVEREVSRMEEALARFRADSFALRAEVAASIGATTGGVKILASLDATDTAMAAMADRALIVFSLVASDRVVEAAAQMAAMAHAYDELDAALGAINTEVSALQAADSSHHLASAREMETLQYGFASALLVILGCAAFFERALLRQAAENAAMTTALDRAFSTAAFSLDGTLLTANENFLRVMGYELSAIKGQHHRHFCERASASDEDYLDFWAALKRGHMCTGHYRRVDKHGREVWIQASYYPVMGASGKPSRIVEFSTDVTAQSQADATHTRLAAIVEASDDAIIGQDVNGIVTSWNHGAERLLGFTAAEILGQPGQSIFPTDRAGEQAALFDKLLQGHQVRLFETQCLHKDGISIFVSINVFPIKGAEGIVTGFGTVARDITERIRARTVIAQSAQDLEQRNVELAEARDRALAATHAKSAFLASMSHEIRTPMNAILGMADLLRETALSPDQQEYVGRFSRAAGRLLELINDVLDISKIEAGQVHMESVPFNLSELVDQVGELMAVRAFAKRLEFVSFLHPDVPTYVVGDPTRMRQVLINLAGNAVKFTEVGEVAVRVEPVATVEPGRLRFSVSDTGIGIPEDKVATIFDSFTQVDSSTTRKYGGTGLGLSISRRLVEMMGGDIAVVSTTGQGSTFSFDLALGVAAAPVADFVTPSVDLRGRRVLVVDDHETNRLIVRAHLSRLGAEVLDAANGSAALQALDEAAHRDTPLDLVILDFHMPGMNGVELAQAIRARADGAILPLLLYASELSGASADDLSKLDLAGHLYKPISRDRLLASVNAALAPSAQALTPRTRPSSASPKESSGREPLRLLLVEDVEDNRDVITLFLKGTPYQVDMAENGALGLEKFRACTYDLVLMDIQMPVMDGYQATAAIRRWEREQGRPPTPIVALTANAFREDVEKAIAAGCDTHVAKPVRKPVLLEAIRANVRERPDQAA
jgi:PAS domain S-box-containing protein